MTVCGSKMTSCCSPAIFSTFTPAFSSSEDSASKRGGSPIATSMLVQDEDEEKKHQARRVGVGAEEEDEQRDSESDTACSS